MERNAKLLALAVVWLWFGLSAAAHAQFLVIGDTLPLMNTVIG